MSVLAYILLFTFIGSVVSLIGGITLLIKENFAVKFSHLISAFAAGALLGTAFFDLLPEALKENPSADVFALTVVGFLFFFVFERALHWFHHHHREHGEETSPTVFLLNFGDAIHNFIDGVAIAATFMVSIPLGIVTSLSVAAHEIPQEIGDFGIMLHQGMKPRDVFLVNFLVALTSFAGALITYFFGHAVDPFLPLILGVTAGFFIYIAASDLIPEIHQKNARGLAITETSLLVLGAIFIKIFVSLFA